MCYDENTRTCSDCYSADSDYVYSINANSSKNCGKFATANGKLCELTPARLKCIGQIGNEQSKDFCFITGVQSYEKTHCTVLTGAKYDATSKICVIQNVNETLIIPDETAQPDESVPKKTDIERCLAHNDSATGVSAKISVTGKLCVLTGVPDTNTSTGYSATVERWASEDSGVYKGGIQSGYKSGFMGKTVTKPVGFYILESALADAVQQCQDMGGNDQLIFSENFFYPKCQVKKIVNDENAQCPEVYKIPAGMGLQLDSVNRSTHKYTTNGMTTKIEQICDYTPYGFYYQGGDLVGECALNTTPDPKTGNCKCKPGFVGSDSIAGIAIDGVAQYMGCALPVTEWEKCINNIDNCKWQLGDVKTSYTTSDETHRCAERAPADTTNASIYMFNEQQCLSHRESVTPGMKKVVFLAPVHKGDCEPIYNGKILLPDNNTNTERCLIDVGTSWQWKTYDNVHYFVEVWFDNLDENRCNRMFCGGTREMIGDVCYFDLSSEVALMFVDITDGD